VFDEDEGLDKSSSGSDMNIDRKNTRRKLGPRREDADVVQMRGLEDGSGSSSLVKGINALGIDSNNTSKSLVSSNVNIQAFDYTNCKTPVNDDK